ncbi:hypothetical protein BBW65_07085 [Helicobacter enhydrae]|uniref:Mor transcription activator domain-containing protein n=1 Tax=Helicobacter enhydrae TaxID=222136 RepID=A0A1B1U798_9HELI|nr:Mor transcription activator family protein [Helicobacter enhydrae]ANV98302.1 hypothetical protein BBW65_05590 [Helicobacter enhydrae]ANV98572.1 hypothetical protein BBW65_07085 [Helicobacter enhydrae]
MRGVLKEICESYKEGMSWEKICKKYGGVNIYVPKVIPSVREQILEEYNGYNKVFLAHKYNLSVRSVEKIVREWNRNSLS